jgi:hypothetical protein
MDLWKEYIEYFKLVIYTYRYQILVNLILAPRSKTLNFTPVICKRTNFNSRGGANTKNVACNKYASNICTQKTGAYATVEKE